MKPAFLVLWLAGLWFWPNPVDAFDNQLWSSYPNMNYVTSLTQGDEQIYIGTTGGIRRYDRFRDRWLEPVTTLNGLPDNRIQMLAYDTQSGDLWFETPSGSGRWLSRLETVSLFSGDQPTRHTRPGVPNLFLPFGYFLEGGWIRGPRQAYQITDTLIDSWRVFWLGTWGLGVGRADLRDERLSFIPSGPICGNVTAIARDGDHIWLGGDDSYRARATGITRYNVADGAWDYFVAEDIVGLDDVRINTVLPDSADVWFGAREGLVRYTRSTDQWLTYRVLGGRPVDVTGLARDANRLWIGTAAGLAVFDLQADTLRSVDGSEQFSINGLAAGRQYIWAATDQGLFRCLRDDATWSQVSSPDAITRLRTTAVVADSAGVWAILDAPPSLIRWTSKDTTWARFPLSEAGGSRRIGLDAHAGRVWVGTDRGVMRFDGASRMWHRYTRFDGLLHDRVQAVAVDGDQVWFGTAEGLSQYRWAMDFFESSH
jgi:ligand-binding sensor domain-containing protein